MKNEYERPSIDIVRFEVEDVIATSGNWTLKSEDGKFESGSHDIFD